jgi:hypothetical protein
MGMSQHLSTTTVYDIDEAVAEVLALWQDRFGPDCVPQLKFLFAEITALFAGTMPGYYGCDTGYHDLNHTATVVLTTARLLDGYIEEGKDVDEVSAISLVMAAMLHDTGYIRRQGEDEGTGAQYTSSHVARSAQFAARHAGPFGLSDPAKIIRFIWATGLAGEFDVQPWQDEGERCLAALLGSADIIGQMSDRVYLEKLLFLYREFREAGFPGYDTEFDILRKTIDFYAMAIQRLDKSFFGLRSCARVHFRLRHGQDRDYYAEAMDNMMAYLHKILEDDTTNFRAKLRRMDVESVLV